jgi:hypothetical protein
MKNLLIAAAVIAAPSAAIAGPYVEAEFNGGWSGSSYDGSKIETHVGYASDLGDSSSWYIQGGPALLMPTDGDQTTELSGKVGLKTELSDNLEAYGEVDFMTSGEIDFDEDLDYGLKVGLTYSF